MTRSCPSFELSILMPVFNDWQAVTLLLPQLDRNLIAAGVGRSYLLLVNDGSSVAVPSFPPNGAFSAIERIEVLHLEQNLGHQRAITVGLSHLWEKTDTPHTLVMDSDGEDGPQDVVKLLAVAGTHPESIVFASRRKRSEGPVFRLFYRGYKLLFQFLTGRHISFGNFTVFPRSSLKSLLTMPESWNHVTAAILKSRLPYIQVQTDRCARLAGQSKMNFTALVGFGLSAIAVFAEIVAVRITILFLLVIGVIALGFIATLAIRFFTDNSIPDWATNVSIGLFILLAQSLSILFIATFNILSNRSLRRFMPISDCAVFIRDVQMVYPTP